MKRALKIVTLLSIVSIFFYWGYTWYSNTTSLLGIIHKDADSAIKISVHDIKKTLLLDVVTSPSYYYNNTSFKRKEKPKDTIDTEGIDFSPYNLVLFTVPEPKNVWFTILNIKDANAFKNQIEEYVTSKGLTQKKDAENNIDWLQNKKQHWVCAWNTEKLIISVGLENSYSKSEMVFDDVLKQNKVINSKKNNWITALSESENHITYLDKKSNVTLQFKDGEAVLEGVVKTDDTEGYPKEVTYSKIPNASIDFYWDANFKNVKNRKRFVKSWSNTSFFKKMNLELPKIAELTNGFFYLGIQGTTMQTDTIITYTYDDNFNKIAEKSFQEKEVPTMVLHLGKDKQSLKTYLSEQELITENHVFTGMPFYQFYTEENPNQTIFKTGELNTPLESVTSTSFMNLSVNFSKAKEDVQIPQATPYFNLLKELQISAQQSSIDKITIEGNLSGVKEQINLLSQLFFGLKSEE